MRSRGKRVEISRTEDARPVSCCKVGLMPYIRVICQMKRRRLGAGILLGMCLAFAWGVLPARAEPAKRIYAGVYLHDVTKFEQKDGVFDADLELWAKWRGDFDPANLVLANSSEVDRQLIGEEKDGDWHSIRWRVRGTLCGEFPVQNFPFDVQTVSVVLELPERLGTLVPDLAGSGIREHFSVTGWLYKPVFFPRISSETYRSDLGTIEGEGHPTKVNRAAFEVTLRRPLITAATKLFLPLMVILLVAFVALFIHPKELDVRASVGVTALLACFAFHFAVADSMPHVSYLTLAEKLFLISYGLCGGLLCVSVAAKKLHEQGRELAHRRLDRMAFAGFPVILACSAFLMVPAATAPSHVTSKAPPEGMRPKSTRELLRIGTNSLPRPIGLLVNRAAYWGTTRTPPGAETFPVLVREVPAITNDALAFLAGGELEITWRLVPGLRWSDGAPLTAEDLLFALKVSADERISELRAINSETLVVKYKERVAGALKEIVPLPRHALAGAFEKGSYEDVLSYRDQNITPSAGAYCVKEFAKDDHLILEANPHFAGAQPSISRIEMRFYPNEAALVKAFESGEIDMITPNAISPEVAQEFASRRPDAVRVRPSDLLLFLHPDLNHPLLAQQAVRKALLQSFNRVRLRDEVFGKAARSAPIAHIPVPGPLPKGTVETSYNPDGAKKELEKLGAAGAHLRLIHGPTTFEREVAARLVRDAAAVGVTLEPVEDPDPSKVYRDPHHGGLLLISRTGLRDDEPEKYWNLPRQKGLYNRNFRSDAFDEAILELVKREERALYPERREQIRDTLFAEFSKRLPLLPLCFLADCTVADPLLKGWDIGTGKSFGLTIERWYFEPAKEPAAPKPQGAK